MIEVEVTCNRLRDVAEADTAEAAVFAAHTLYDEHGKAAGWSFPITTTFRVDGKVVYTVKGRRAV